MNPSTEREGDPSLLPGILRTVPRSVGPPLLRSLLLAATSVACTTGPTMVPTGPSYLGTPAPSTPTPTQTQTPATPSPPATQATRITVTGNGPLTRVGETTQLTATATLIDGTTKDVTSEARWSSTEPRVITISTGGLLTVVDFGIASVSAAYQGRVASVNLTATPAGTYAMQGRVREPGGGPLTNATVRETITGRTLTTNLEGQFSVGNLPSLSAHFKVEQTGFEPGDFDEVQQYVDLPLQRIVRLTAGETVKPDVLAPNDLSYTVGGTRCDDCRLIRVIVPQAGTVHVRVTWTVMASKLTLFAEGQMVAGDPGSLSADVPVSSAREVLMYLGTVKPNAINSHTAFTFATTLD